jgi:16S rRNA (guanine527-N7)-methyltransferase
MPADTVAGSTAEHVSNLLEDGARALGIPLAPSAPKRLAAFLGVLVAANQHVNLVGRGLSVEDIVERHLLDSLALLLLIPSLGRVLDVGSGAGLPGLVLWLAAPGERLTLLEPTRKRADFLRAAIHALQVMDAEVVEARLEDFPAAVSHDLLLSRATFPAPVWIRRGAAVLAPGGRIAAMLARRDHEETLRGARRAGLRLVAEQRFVLPWSGAARRNLVFEK